MSLTRYELQKIIRTPLVLIALAALLLLDIGSLLFGSQPGYKATQPPFETNLTALQQSGRLFAGEITAEWVETRQQEKQAIIDNPENQVSAQQRQAIRQEYLAKGYSEEYIDELGAMIYLKPEVISSHNYNQYEDVEVAGKFYDRAKQTGQLLAYEYRSRYPGRKGETLAAKTEELYQNLAENYTAFYDYDWGYWKLRNLHTSYPFSIGLLVLIGLSPVFSAEYAKKTDAILLSSKHGKRKLIVAKVNAGLIFAVAIWGLVELINALLVFGCYGTTGANAYWQNFFMDYAPFPLNQLQITLITLATSLLGTVFLASVILLISVCSKNQFVSLLIGGVVLLAPCLNFAFTDNLPMQTLYNFMPTRVLIAIHEWQRFELLYLFGQAIPIQYVIIVAALLLSGGSIFLCGKIFRRRQVEN